MRILVLALTALALLTLAQPAHAELDARARYERGLRLFNLQKWDQALADFQQVYLERPDPVLLFNIAQCQRQLGQYEAASKSYRLFLAQKPQAANREQVYKLIDQMDAAAREQRANEPPTGPQPQLAEPTPQEAAATPLVSPPAAEVSAAQPRPWYKSTAGWAVGGSGVILVGVGGALLGVAGSEGRHASNATTVAGFDEHHGNDLTYQQAGWPLLGVGVIAVATGATLFGLAARHRSHHP